MYILLYISQQCNCLYNQSVCIVLDCSMFLATSTASLGTASELIHMEGDIFGKEINSNYYYCIMMETNGIL